MFRVVAHCICLTDAYESIHHFHTFYVEAISELNATEIAKELIESKREDCYDFQYSVSKC